MRMVSWCNNNEGFASVILSTVTIIISIVAIYISIKTPMQQNKIALFEKRYDVYKQVLLINNFIDGYYQTVDTITMLPSEKYYEALWEGEVHPYVDSSLRVNIVINQQQNNIKQSIFLFDNINDEEHEKLINYINCYYAMTQEYIVIPNADAYYQIKKSKDDYQKVFQNNDIVVVIEKMKEQLAL